MYAHLGSGCKTQGLGFVTLPEGMERGLQHDTVRFTHQLTFVTSIAHKATGASQWLCSDAPDLLRSKARSQPRNPANTHRQEQSASPHERQLALARFRSTDLDVY